MLGCASQLVVTGDGTARWIGAMLTIVVLVPLVFCQCARWMQVSASFGTGKSSALTRIMTVALQPLELRRRAGGYVGC